MRFEGKVCLVTGAGSGIGKATAKQFASEGGKVAILTGTTLVVDGGRLDILS